MFPEALIEDENVIKKILKPLGLWGVNPRPPPKATGPQKTPEYSIDYFHRDVGPYGPDASGRIFLDPQGQFTYTPAPKKEVLITITEFTYTPAPKKKSLSSGIVAIELFKKIKHRRISEAIASQVRDAILDGTLKSGDRLASEMGDAEPGIINGKEMV